LGILTNCFLILLICLCDHCFPQQTVPVFTSDAQQENFLSGLHDIPSRYYSKVNKKISSVNDQLTKKSLKYLAKFQRQEQKLQQKLAKLHPELPLINANEKYNELSQKIKSKTAGETKTASGEYSPYLDSLGSSLSFLKQYNGISDKVKEPFAGFTQLQSNLQQSEKIKEFLAERKNQVKELLSKYTEIPGSLKNEYNKLNKTAYYYSAQVKEYKELLNNPGKLEMKVLSMLNQLPAFQVFIKEHSALSGLFNLPGNYGSAEALAGLQTREQVEQLITNQVGGGPNAGQLFGRQVQAGQQQLQQFKDKLNKLGGGSGDIEMPDFKPNNQKTKSFFQRLEYGSNLQTTRGTYNFPTTTDLGLSVGYKLNNKSTIGIGASYKGGWGRDIQHINITAEGMGLRSFFEFKLKKSFYATGGLEYNYQQPFNSIQQIEKKEAWQQSGLIGISKVIDVKSKIFKKTKLQLLWDFLSYQQTIRTQPLKFRVGYNF
jgi:hypothetical protein